MTARPRLAPDRTPTPARGPTTPEAPGQVPVALRVLSGSGRSKWRPFSWLAYSVVAVAAFLAFVYLRTAVDEVVYDISSTQAQIDAEMERKARLEDERRELQSPWEIVPIAERMLGMVLPEDVKLVSLGGPLPPGVEDPAARTGGG